MRRSREDKRSAAVDRKEGWLMTSSEKSISRRSFLGLTGAAATITAAAGLYGRAQPAPS
ncbi:twin-arginine translocation signal domain-containing protein, partial [Adlercreutzia sp.]|uniref:twin-arginine translocation signal domain-containing protein n=1 Tax=Adlercreutzia sp. TaxID=1872387 RepID=UPI003AB172C6